MPLFQFKLSEMLKSLTLWYIISVRGTAQHSKALFGKKKSYHPWEEKKIKQDVSETRAELTRSK